MFTAIDRADAFLEAIEGAIFMSENSIQGNGNWYLTDGQWISDEGADLSVADAFATGNPPEGYLPDNIPSAIGNPAAGDNAGSGSGIPFANSDDSSGDNLFPGGGAGFGEGNPFADGGVGSGEGNPLAAFFMGGGGNVSTTSEDGQYSFNYTRTSDERSLMPDDNNPFSQLLGVIGVDSGSLASGTNPFAAGSANDGTSSDDGSNPFLSGALGSDGNSPVSNGNNPFVTGGGNSSFGGNIPGGNNPFGGSIPGGGNPPSSEDNALPEAPEGLSVPYASEDWISDLKDLESGEPGASSTGNTGSGNGNWFYGSNNTANGNGNWNLSDGNTSDGNGNWNLGTNNTVNGNGNWNFGTGNTSDGNGNWQLGDNNTISGNGNQPTGTDNTVNGNGNRPSGSANNILGNANTSDSSNSSLLGNRIQATGDGTYIGNEDWSFDILDELMSTGVGVSGIGSDVRSLVNHPDLISNATSKEGYSNSTFLANDNYQFDSSSGM
jgi:hypothetical protein